MVKKLIGIVVAVAVIVIIVVTAIRRHNFQSMVLRDEIENLSLPKPVNAPTVEVQDSVTVEVTDSTAVK